MTRRLLPPAAPAPSGPRAIRRALALALTASAAIALVSCATLPDDGYQIEAIECDPASTMRDPSIAFTPLGGETFAVTGWSHASSTETLLALPHPEYVVSRDNFTPDATCAGQSTFDVVLVKRLVDWDRQHMNGIEAVLPDNSVRFADVTDFTLELRLVPERSSIPSPDALAAHFADVLDPTQIRELDSGEVNLELTLFGERATADRPFLNAGTIIAIDPADWSDGWVRVTVPIEALDGYTEVDYERTPVELGDYPELVVRGLRINPESANGRVLRHYQLDDFEVGATPELFKEMALSIALVEVGHE